MVLTQKHFSVQGSKCAPQTNTEDVGDNKLCLDALKNSGQWRYLQAASFTINSGGTPPDYVGTALANGSTMAGAVVAGQQNVGGTWPASGANAGFMTGYQRWTVPGTVTGGVALTGLSSNKLLIKPDNASFNNFKVQPVMSAASAEGTYSVTSYILDMYMAASATAQTTSFDADIYINVSSLDNQ